jgi:hypothetical protein
MTTPTLPYRQQQQNITQSHFSPLQSLKKKVGLIKIDAAKLPVNEIKQKRSGTNLIRRKECDQPGSFPIIHSEVTAVLK